MAEHRHPRGLRIGKERAGDVATERCCCCGTRTQSWCVTPRQFLTRSDEGQPWWSTSTKLGNDRVNPSHSPCSSLGPHVTTIDQATADTNQCCEFMRR
jgi:hypothetical protein